MWPTGWDLGLIGHPDHVPPSLYSASKTPSSASDSQKYVAEVNRKRLWVWESQDSVARGLEENAEGGLLLRWWREPLGKMATFPGWST